MQPQSQAQQGQSGRSMQGVQPPQQPPQGSMQQRQGQQAPQPPQQPQRGAPGTIQSQQGGAPTSPVQGGPGAQQRGVQPQIQQGSAFLEPMSVDDAVQTEVYTVERDTSISDVVEEMDDLDVGSAVVEEDGTPIGILTDRKIAMALADEPNVVEQTAEDLTSGEVVSAMEGTQVTEVLDKMSDESIRRIPVVDENGELEGIVTLDDILMLLESKMNQVSDTIEGQLPQI